FTVEFHNFSCVLLNPTLVLQLDCILHKKSIAPSISVIFKLTKQVNEFNLLYHLQVLKMDDSKMTIARHKLDGCKFLASLYSQSIMAKFFKRIRSVSNLPKKCPVPGNKLFEIRNYTVLAEEYPPNVPAMSYEFRMKIEYRSKVVAEIIVIGNISY
ncbi:hypothetical protein KR093_007523, partial [Drosophila rubida]